MRHQHPYKLARPPTSNGSLPLLASSSQAPFKIVSTQGAIDQVSRRLQLARLVCVRFRLALMPHLRNR